jgi:hypothetical protein
MSELKKITCPAGIVCNTVTANQSIFLMLNVKFIKFFKYSFLTNLYPTFYVGIFRGGGSSRLLGN